MSSERRVIVLGSTGSIGTQTLAVVEHLAGLRLGAMSGGAPGSPALRIVGLVAGRNGALLREQAARHGSAAVLTSEAGEQAAIDLVERTPCELVVSAMSGSAGLPATLRALELGRDVALANKEALVAAGALMTSAARASGAKILPMDSEHAGVWECVRGLTAGEPPSALGAVSEVSRVVLTASGGPFRTWSRERLEAATPEEALRHPTWKMGPKVTVDSASLMNKALELIEAHWLFGLAADKLGVVVHPQSIVHALVELSTGSTLAQLGSPDMRTPIQSAMTWPARVPGLAARPNLAGLGRLEFEPVDPVRFPAVELAERVIRVGNSAGAVLNAANEVAVESFLAGRLGFCGITDVVSRTLDRLGGSALGAGLRGLAAIDAEARACARSCVASSSSGPARTLSRELWS